MSGMRRERDRKNKRRRTHESDSPRSMYDDDSERLDIKPPQAKHHKHGKSRYESSHKHSQPSRHHSKSSHHKRYSKERYEREKSDTEEMPPPLMREYSPDRTRRDYAKYPDFKEYLSHHDDVYRDYGRIDMGEEDDAINEYRGGTAMEYAGDMGGYENYHRDSYYQDPYYQEDQWTDRQREPSETLMHPDSPRQLVYHEEGRQKESKRLDSRYVSHRQSDKQKEHQQQRTEEGMYGCRMPDSETSKIHSKTKESDRYLVREVDSSRYKDRREAEKSKQSKDSIDKMSSISEQKYVKKETHDKSEPEAAEKSKHRHKTRTIDDSKPIDPKIVSTEVKPELLEKEFALREKLIRKRLAKVESTDTSVETLPHEEKEEYSEGESKAKSQKPRKRKRGEKTPVIVLSDESSNYPTSLNKKRSGKTVEIGKPVINVSSPIVLSDEENKPSGRSQKDESQTESISAKTKKHRIEVKPSSAHELSSSEMNFELENSDAPSPVAHRNKKTKKKLKKKKRSSHKGSKKSKVKHQTKKDKKRKDKETYIEEEEEKVRDKEGEKVNVTDKEVEKLKDKEKEGKKVKAKKVKVKDKEKRKVKRKEKVKDKERAKEKKRQKDNEWLEKQEKKRLELIAEAEMIEQEARQKEAEAIAQKNRGREKAKRHERERSRDTDGARKHEREKSEERWNKEFSRDRNLGRERSYEEKEREKSYDTYYHRDRSRDRVYGRGEYERDKSRDRDMSRERWAYHGDTEADYKREKERSTNVSPAREISRERGYERSRDKNRSKDRSISREPRRSKERGRSKYKRERSYDEDSRERRRNRSREDRDRDRSENRRKDHRKGRDRDRSRSRKDDKEKYRRDHDKRRSRSRSSSRSRSHRTRRSKYSKSERRYSKEKTKADPKKVISKEKKKVPGEKVVKSAEEKKLSALRRLIRKKQKCLLEKQLNKPKSNTYIPALDGCRSVEEFKCLNRIEEGTYGVVYRAQDKRTNKIVALKRLKMEREKEGFPITSLREINTLLKSQHPNIVTVKEIVVGSNMDKIFIVMDYVEHDLKSLMETMKKKKSGFLIGEIKCLMLQLLRAIAHLHDNWILHRDLKTSNLLFSHQGILKVGDFGLAREYGSPLKVYTPVVVTLWYRSPELLLGTKLYSTPVDMWSIGCIFAELLTMEALFQGKSEIDQLNKIYRMLGTPTEKSWPGFSDLPMAKKVIFGNFPSNQLRIKFMPPLISEAGFNLLSRFLIYNPKKRISAAEALKHDYFIEPPRAIEPAMFPTWPAKSEPGFQVASPKPPPGGLYTESADGEGFFIAPGDKRTGFNPGYSLKSTFNLKF